MIISDNGLQLIADDFKNFVRITGVTHVRTSTYNQQSNGKFESWHDTLQGERFRLAAPENVNDARCVVGWFVAHYNEVRLHSAIGYITPKGKLAAERKRTSPIASSQLQPISCLEDAQRRYQEALTIGCQMDGRERLTGI
jgi:transposase InsO family protein